jgi:hypothetical protein
MIIKTSAGQLYRVVPCDDPRLSHVWNGTAVKKSNGAYVDKKNARPELVRRAGCVVVQA